jgi:hypothetical protein
MKKIAAAAAFLLALILMIVGVPDIEARIARIRPELEKELDSREYHIDPGELLSLMYNNQILLILLDVRTEEDHNLFHLKDAIWKPLEQMTDDCCKKLAAQGVKVIMSNDEARADKVWMHLKANDVPNTYILAGGINTWLDLFRDGKKVPPLDEIIGGGDDRLRHTFDKALGHDWPASLPDPEHIKEREFPTKVKVEKPAAVEGGGCG